MTVPEAKTTASDAALCFADDCAAVPVTLTFAVDAPLPSGCEQADRARMRTIARKASRPVFLFVIIVCSPFGGRKDNMRFRKP